VSTRSKLEDLSAHIKGVEGFNVKSGCGTALFTGAHAKCTGYDAPIVIRVHFSKKVKLTHMSIDVPAQHGLQVYLFANCHKGFNLDSAEGCVADPKQPWHAQFEIDTGGGVHGQPIRVKGKEAALCEVGFETLGIYFKEVSEDDEDELTVINSIKLYGPKTSNATMEISKLEKVG